MTQVTHEHRKRGFGSSHSQAHAASQRSWSRLPRKQTGGSYAQAGVSQSMEKGHLPKVQLLRTDDRCVLLAGLRDCLPESLVSGLAQCREGPGLSLLRLQPVATPVRLP